MSVLDSLERIIYSTDEVEMTDEVFEIAIKNLLISNGDKDIITEAKKVDPTAKVRNKPDPVFPAGSSKVKDDVDHFPLGSARQAKNALARASGLVKTGKYKKWYKGSGSALLSAVKKAVKKNYPDIEISKE